ncbi:MAG: SDR family NAD(P)-dependent oxidoreductase [Actinomycetota bacterium]|nr:SDR family NAD(P)-dependent oxidoreductase [Actinomycetota bacterium]
MEISGKRILLTGATGGLGRAIAQALAARGGTVISSSRKGPELEELTASLPGEGHESVVSDLAEEGAPERLLAAAGEIDILVANAGLPASGRIEGYSEDQIKRALRVNLEAPILLAHALLGPMQARGAGHLVFISSLNGKVATARSSLYSATKFGLRGFALGMREDLRGTAVGSSVVMPGTVRDAGMFADSGAQVPRGAGTASPQEVAAAVISAVERDRAEVEVAPRVQRLLANFAARRPDLAGKIASRTGVDKVADAVADNQADKR